MLPIEMACTQPSAERVQLRLLLPPELFWFRGHFPGQPVLPGIAQIHWAQHYAQERLGVAGAFAGMQGIKFQTPATQSQLLELELQWSAAKQLLKFSYILVAPVADPLPVSSGKIRLSM